MNKEAFDLEAVNETFATHPTLEVVYQTSDGQCFSKLEAAEAHRYNCKDRTIAEVKREQTQAQEQEPENKSQSLKAEEAIEAVKQFTDKEELAAFVEGDKRKTVIEAATEQAAIIEANS